MAEGFDGKELIKILQKYLPANSTVLELGMGPGKDLNILRKNYTITGSDTSQIFLERYKKQNPFYQPTNLNFELLCLQKETSLTDTMQSS